VVDRHTLKNDDIDIVEKESDTKAIEEMEKEEIVGSIDLTTEENIEKAKKGEPIKIEVPPIDEKSIDTDKIAESEEKAKEVLEDLKKEKSKAKVKKSDKKKSENKTEEEKPKVHTPIKVPSATE